MEKQTKLVSTLFLSIILGVIGISTLVIFAVFSAFGIAKHPTELNKPDLAASLPAQPMLSENPPTPASSEPPATTPNKHEENEESKNTWSSDRTTRTS